MSLTAGASGGRVAAAPQGQLGRPQPTGGPLPPLPQQQQPQQTWFEPARGNSNTGGTGIWAGGKSTTYYCWRILNLVSIMDSQMVYTASCSWIAFNLIPNLEVICGISGHDFISFDVYVHFGSRDNRVPSPKDATSLLKAGHRAEMALQSSSFLCRARNIPWCRGECTSRRGRRMSSGAWPPGRLPRCPGRPPPGPGPRRARWPTPGSKGWLGWPRCRPPSQLREAPQCFIKEMAQLMDDHT